MEYKSFDQLIEHLGAKGKRRVVVAAAQDSHALEAVVDAAGKGIVDYLLVGDRDEICRVAQQSRLDIQPDCIVPAQSDQQAAAKAVALVREGAGDFLMKGKLMTACLLKEVVNTHTGIRASGVISHIAVLQAPAYHKLLCVSDGGMIPHPDLPQKQSIAENAVAFLQSIGVERPKVALLAAVEAVNPRMPETEEALRVMEFLNARGGCIAQGPLSLDLALSRASAAVKGVDGPVVGDADILITPEIVSGNLLSKSMIYTGGAVMAGCVVGARAPIVLTSRGASAQEKYLSLVIAAASCQAVPPRKGV